MGICRQRLKGSDDIHGKRERERERERERRDSRGGWLEEW
jgi:hypothetical protein